MFYKEQHMIYPYKSTNKPSPLSNLKAFADGNFIVAQMVQFLYDRVENTVEQERQIVARYARLTPSCKAGACTGQNSSMKNNKRH